jgi:glutamyl-tRNA synthetase
MTITRFAPSPTGFLHLGGARTALFSFAYAKKHLNGKFLLRIEDTDLERSTQQSVDSIIDAMKWLNLSFDNPDGQIYYQTAHLSRYQELITKLLEQGHAYHCYCSKAELDTMREQQKAAGLKPKYDKRCLHNKTIKPGVLPVVRFKTSDNGSVIWNDLVKGTIEINNAELDDLIIARSDGTPTYNFCVVVDDMDMGITHVIRGDDHVNNTPRQINIFKALGCPIPEYAHVPMILRDDGQKMSKRTDAVSVMQYKDMGILPEALLNYLARLCFGHGDDEIFTLEQFIQWFDFKHVSASPARFDMQKLLWVNAEHLKATANDQLITLVMEIWHTNRPDLIKTLASNNLNLTALIDLYKPRVNNLNSLANELATVFIPLKPTIEDQEKHLTLEAKAILAKFAIALTALNSWNLDNLKVLIKDFCTNNNIKMPALGMPLRLKLCGTTQTPSFDALVYLLGLDIVLARINSI